MEKEQQQELFEQYQRHMHAGKEGPVSASPAPSNIVKAAEMQPGKSKGILTLSYGNKVSLQEVANCDWFSRLTRC